MQWEICLIVPQSVYSIDGLHKGGTQVSEQVMSSYYTSCIIQCSMVCVEQDSAARIARPRDPIRRKQPCPCQHVEQSMLRNRFLNAKAGSCKYTTNGPLSMNLPAGPAGSARIRSRRPPTGLPRIRSRRPQRRSRRPPWQAARFQGWQGCWGDRGAGCQKAALLAGALGAAKFLGRSMCKISYTKVGFESCILRKKLDIATRLKSYTAYYKKIKSISRLQENPECSMQKRIDPHFKIKKFILLKKSQFDNDKRQTTFVVTNVRQLFVNVQ